MKPLPALKSAYGSSRAVIQHITSADLAKPTPCAEWDVGALLNHYINAIATFPIVLAGGTPDWSRQLQMPEPAAAFDEAVGDNLSAWAVAGAVDTEAPMLPGMRLVDLNLIDAVVHTADLAKALNITQHLDNDVVAFVLDRWEKAPLDVSRQFGAFGPEVKVARDAPALDRLLGLSGRQP